jgi:purine nucleosidase
MTRRFLIDTDTASDDAVALVMALQHPDVQVEAITTVAGNVPVEQGTQNALYTVELCGKDTPVYMGMDRPLLRPLETAQNVHGGDGMGDIGLPLSGRSPAPGNAVDVIVETINNDPGEITFISIGPLTNLAMALLRDPGIAHKVERYIMMGGIGYGYGNITPVAEYNIWVDPEAAAVVFRSGLPITMVGWDVSWQYAVLGQSEVEAMRIIGTPLADFCLNIQSTLTQYAVDVSKLENFDLPDPIAMAVALDPTIVTNGQRLFVEVCTDSELCRGQTVVDHVGVTGSPPNTEVILAADHARFLQMLFDAVR